MSVVAARDEGDALPAIFITVHVWQKSLMNLNGSLDNRRQLLPPHQMHKAKLLYNYNLYPPLVPLIHLLLSLSMQAGHIIDC